MMSIFGVMNNMNRKYIIQLFDISNNLVREFRCNDDEWFKDINGMLIGIGYRDEDKSIKETIYFGSAVAYTRVTYAPD
jgi:hypothetical protein